MFTACHNYAISHDSLFHVDSAFISDSNLVINMLLDKEIATDIPDLTLKAGVKLYNNEIAEGSLSMNFYYFTKNRKGQGFKAIGDQVFSISHVNKAKRIESKIGNLNNLNQYSNEIIKNLEIVNFSRILTPIEIYAIFENFTHSGDINKGLKSDFIKLRNQIADQTFNLISLFDKFDKLVDDSDVEKKIVLQKMFHDYITSKGVKS